MPSDVVRSLYFHMSTYEQTRRSFEKVLAELHSANEREQQLQAFLRSNRATNLQWMTDQLNDAEHVDAQMQLWFQTLRTTIAENDQLIQQRPGLLLGDPEVRKIGILQALTNKLTQLRLCPACGRNPCVCQYTITRSKQVVPSASNTHAMTSAPSALYERWNGVANALESVATACPTMPSWHKIQALSAWGVRSSEWRGALTSHWSMTMRVRLETGDWHAGLVESSGTLAVEKMLRVYLQYDSERFSPDAPLLDDDIVRSLQVAAAASVGVVGSRFGTFIRDATGTHVTFDASRHPFLWQSETDPAMIGAFSKYVRKELVLTVEHNDETKQTTLSWTDPRTSQVPFSESTVQSFQDWSGDYVPVCFALNRCEMYVSGIRIDERQVQQPPTAAPPVDVGDTTCTPSGPHLGETAGCIGHTLW